MKYWFIIMMLIARRVGSSDEVETDKVETQKENSQV